MSEPLAHPMKQILDPGKPAFHRVEPAIHRIEAAFYSVKARGEIAFSGLNGEPDLAPFAANRAPVAVP